MRVCVCARARTLRRSTRSTGADVKTDFRKQAATTE